MSVILVLITFSVLVAAGFLAAFIWSVKDGQYEDNYSDSVRILFDDEKFNQDDSKIASPKKSTENFSNNH